MSKEWRVERAGDDEHRSDERWLVTYADMITVLLIFFITMYAVSTRIDAETFAQMAKSLHNSLQPKSKEKVKEFDKTDTEIASGSLSFYVKRAVAPYKALSHVKVDRTSEGTVIALADNSFFDLGSSTLKDSGKGALLSICKVIATMSEEISVEGYTDSTAAGNNPGVANWVIAAQRAAAVVNFMTIHGHVPAKRFQVVSWGQYNNHYKNDSAAHRAMNRRVDIIIHDHPPARALTPPSPSPEALSPAFAPDPNSLPKQPKFNAPTGGMTNPFGNNF